MPSPVLLYHKIDHPTPDVKIRGAFTSPEKFRRQVKYLKSRGYEFFTALEMVRHLRDHRRYPDRSVCITFDDGWKDNYDHAFPVLKEFDVKATIFLVPSLLGQTSDQVTADGEAPREHLSIDNVREMAGFGIEFGSHSLSHKLFDRTPDDEIERQVVESKARIEDILQRTCTTFAYPAGFFTDFSKHAISKAGFLGAFSTVYGAEDNSDFFALNRTEILHRHGRPFQFGRRLRSIFARA